jgi:aspartate/methionine/tyrosine aminotransferase
MEKGGVQRLARRMAEIEPFHVMALLARARELEAQGRSIIHMEIGEPDFPTPEPVIRAGVRALERGELFYTPTPGLPQLREAIAGYYRSRYGVAISASRILVTTGASAALMLACAALIDPGDEVLLADPGYPANRHFVRVFEGVPRAVPVDAASGYQLAPTHLERHWGPRTAAALVASPSNPTGTLISTERLAAMVEIVRGKGGTLIVDEIYHGLVYEGEYTTAAAFVDDVFVINSFSKYFNMTGWRLGWMVVPEPLVETMRRFAANLFLVPPTLSQHVALAAMDEREELERRVATYAANRQMLIDALLGLGITRLAPADGAFYLYADVGHLTGDSLAWCRELLDATGVALNTGKDFDGVHGDRFIRISFAVSTAETVRAIECLDAWLRKRKSA